MPIDDEDEESPFRILFEINRIIDVHWTRSLDDVWGVGACSACRGRADCPQLDWALERYAELASVMLQK